MMKKEYSLHIENLQCVSTFIGRSMEFKHPRKLLNIDKGIYSH